MLAGPGERERDRYEKKDRKQRKQAGEGYLLFMKPPHVAWQLEGISHSPSLAQQLPKLMTLRITANGAWFLH